MFRAGVAADGDCMLSVAMLWSSNRKCFRIWLRLLAALVDDLCGPFAIFRLRLLLLLLHCCHCCQSIVVRHRQLHFLNIWDCVAAGVFILPREWYWWEVRRETCPCLISSDNGERGTGPATSAWHHCNCGACRIIGLIISSTIFWWRLLFIFSSSLCLRLG